jgi:hypothetical protein
LELEKATGTPIPEPTKVRRLLKSLQASTMQVPVAKIRETENLKTDFDATVNYLRNFINTIDQETRNVAPVSSGNERHHSNKGSSNGKGDKNDKNKSEDKTVWFYDKIRMVETSSSRAQAYYQGTWKTQHL